VVSLFFHLSRIYFKTFQNIFKGIKLKPSTQFYYDFYHLLVIAFIQKIILEKKSPNKNQLYSQSGHFSKKATIKRHSHTQFEEDRA